MKSKIFILLLISHLLPGQISPDVMIDAEKMKYFFLNKNYQTFSTFVYPEIVRMSGGREKMIRMTRERIDQTEQDGFKIINIYFKDFNETVEHNNELQTAFTQVVLMDTPKGRVEAEYTMIGISGDQGKNWKFIDTSGYTDEMIHRIFPNVSKFLSIQSGVKKLLDEKKLRKKCTEFRNLELQALTPFTQIKTAVIILEDTIREISDDESFIASKVLRDADNPCKMQFSIEEIHNKPADEYKIGGRLRLEITSYENGSYYYIATLDQGKLLVSDRFTVVKGVQSY